MINEQTISGFLNRYKNIHPLIIYRTADKVNTAGEMFDILEEFPKEYPVSWDSNQKRWTIADDVTLEDTFDTTLGVIL